MSIPDAAPADIEALTRQICRSRQSWARAFGLDPGTGTGRGYR